MTKKYKSDFFQKSMFIKAKDHILSNNYLRQPKNATTILNSW